MGSWSSDSDTDSVDGGESSGRAIQLIEFKNECNEGGAGLSLQLNLESLQIVNDSTKGRPVCVVSVVGPPRQGKSFLLNYIKRALEAMENDEVDWINSDSKKNTLSGFCWSTQYEPQTKGIWVWSRAFLVDGDDNEVAVILMDTQGFDDESSSPEELASILGLSFLSSSVMIYNVAGELPDDVFRNLSNYFKFGMHCLENDEDGDDEPPFQKLSLLVRDWNNPAQHEYGVKGGKSHLEDQIKTLKGKEQKKIKDAMKKCFGKVDCFLMPNIGEQALTATFKGCIGELSPDFANSIKSYINGLLKNEDLRIKKILGAEVVGFEWANIVQAFVKMYNDGFNEEDPVTEETLWDVTSKVLHENLVEKCVRKYQEIILKKQKSSKYLPEDTIEIAHTQGLKQAKTLFKRTKKLQEFRSQYEKKMDKELLKALEEFKEKNEASRKRFVSDCIGEANDAFREKLSMQIPIKENEVTLYSPQVILHKAEIVKQDVTKAFLSNFNNEDDDKLANLEKSLHNVLDSVLQSAFLDRNKRNQEAAEQKMNEILENLLQEYKSEMEKFIAKQPFTEIPILSHFHDICKQTLMEKFEQLEKPSDEDLNVQYELHFHKQFNDAFEAFASVQKSKTDERMTKAEQLLQFHLDGYSKLLKMKAEELTCEEDLKVGHDIAVPVMVEKFNAVNPFPAGTSQHQSLIVRFKDQLKTVFTMAVREGIEAKQRLEEMYKNAVTSCFELYLAAMEKARNDAEFLESEKLDAEHNSFSNDAQTHFYDMTKVGNLEAAEPHKLNLEKKIENQFKQVVTENEHKIKFAESEAKNWISDCLKEYDGLMRKPIATCKEMGELIEAHNEIKEKVFTSFHSKWYYKTQTLKNKFVGQLREELEETFVELKDVFDMRRASDASGTKEAKEEARKFYHEEMEKHFKNDQFMQLRQLQALHERVSRNAIKRCTDKTPLKDTQIEDLKQSLGKSFNKYQEKNDISLNWDCGNEPAIGIDLGTTYCCVAVYFKGKVQIIRNSLGSNTTPSYVAFSDDGSRVIGQAAKDNAFRNPENTIFDAKRMIGRGLQDKDLQNDMKFWPFNVVEGAEGPAVEIHGKQYPPEQIGSFLLGELRDQAEKLLKIPINKAVITVPAYFNDGQRAATVDAGEMAGLEVLTILNEPTAAAIAYKLERFDEDARTVVIFDLGGGTYDLAILRTEEGKIEVLGVDGDTHLGGEDFDKNMMKHCAKAFQSQHGIDLFLGKDSLVKQERDAARQRLRRLQTHCEKNKIDLTTARSTIVTVDSLVDGKDLSVKVTRAEFEEMNEQHFKKTIDIVDRALKDVGVRKEDIDDIVLVGGSTRILKVQEMLAAYFNGKALNHTIHPDEAVAYGAAVQAALLNGTEAKKALNLSTIQDVTPMSLGVEAKIGDVSGLFSVIVPKNTQFPTKIKEPYFTSANNQTNVTIKIYQGESSVAKQNNLLGEFVLEGIPPGPAGRERVEVIMEIDAMGILHVTAICKSTRGSKGLTIAENRGRLSKDTKRRLLEEGKASRQAAPS
ncbi:unnamed protein product [Orchesella dallaii]|uniref:GB1/RHD3-type G domain-containing protein n=1 Tax=Orchesella dallaii TaxID=48710 RepID=A0ABP1PJM3_9HEXA